MRKAKREFDAVGTMRKIRDRLSNEVEGMTFEEEKLFIQKHVAQPKAHGLYQPAHAARQASRKERKAYAG
jgi:hypothetical protein